MPAAHYNVLQKWSTAERLSEDNMWYCNRCKDHKQARKQLTVWTLPHILIVHLKRFIYNKYERRRDSKLVRCPRATLPGSESAVSR